MPAIIQYDPLDTKIPLNIDESPKIRIFPFGKWFAFEYPGECLGGVAWRQCPREVAVGARNRCLGEVLRVPKGVTWLARNRCLEATSRGHVAG